MQELLGPIADQKARQWGSVQRQRKFSGATLAQTLILGWLANPAASLEELAQMAATRGVAVSAQAIDQRFGPAAADFLEALLGEALLLAGAGPSAPLPILEQFNGVYLIDSSTVALPDELKDQWAGVGGRTATTSRAGLKLEVGLDLLGGTLQGPFLADGRTHDAAVHLQEAALPRGAMRVTDLGYFSLDRLARMNAEGIYWLTRLKHQTRLYDSAGEAFSLDEALEKAAACGFTQKEWMVALGVRYRIPARLLAERVPDQVANQRRRKLRRTAQKHGRTPSKRALRLCAWTLLVTNASAERLSVAQALVLYRARWQIELLFKCWKSTDGINRWRSQNPWRRLCELYAKLIAGLLRHWVVLMSCWHRPDRSLVKATQTIRHYAVYLAAVFDQTIALREALYRLQQCLQSGCRLDKRRQHPATFQQLQHASAHIP